MADLRLPERLSGDIVVTTACGAKVYLDDTEHNWNLVSVRNWCLVRGYPLSRIAGKGVYMHQLLLPDAEMTDHVDGDPLNNRSSNLRAVTSQQNQRNKRGWSKCGMKGVHVLPSGRWRASITVDYRRIHIGCYATLAEAAYAYDQKARELFGAFARVNFPGE